MADRHCIGATSHTCIKQPQCVVGRGAQIVWVNAAVGWLPLEGGHPSIAVIVPPLANTAIGRLAGVVHPYGIADLRQNAWHRCVLHSRSGLLQKVQGQARKWCSYPIANMLSVHNSMLQPCKFTVLTPD